MKFTWKVVGLTILLLAFSLSAGGYLVIRTSFDARLETEITAAQEDMELFSMAVQAICLPEISDIPESLMQPVLRSVLQGQRQLQSYPFRLSDAAGRTVFQSGTLPEKLQLPTADGEMETRICAGNEYLLTTERLALRGQVFFLERSREDQRRFCRGGGKPASVSVDHAGRAGLWHYGGHGNNTLSDATDSPNLQSGPGIFHRKLRTAGKRPKRG